MKKNWFTSLTFAKQIERVEKNAHLYKKQILKEKPDSHILPALLVQRLRRPQPHPPVVLTRPK